MYTLCWSVERTLRCKCVLTGVAKPGTYHKNVKNLWGRSGRFSEPLLRHTQTLVIYDLGCLYSADRLSGSSGAVTESKKRKNEQHPTCVIRAACHPMHMADDI